MKFLDIVFCGSLPNNDTRLPPFLGPTLRGAFGLALKKVVCQMSHGNCPSCILRDRCAYPIVFDGIPPTDRTVMRKYPQVPQPFVLVVDDDYRRRNGELRWVARLFGNAARYWPSVTQAFLQACETGIGGARYPVTISKVETPTGDTLWSPVGGWGNEVSLVVVPNQMDLPQRCALKWRFKTPICGVEDKSARHITGLSLFLHGRRRFGLLRHFYSGTQIESMPERRFDAQEFETVSYNLRHWNCSRFSHRQQSRMELWGVIGEITISGPWGETGDWLPAAPFIHLGKSTSFGCGQVEWELVAA